MIIAVDFDGTIAVHEFPEIGRAVAGAFYWLNEFKRAGATLILWTMRSDGREDGRDYLAEAEQFCADNGVDFDFLNEHPQDWTTSPKVYAHTYIDDAAFGCPLRDSPLGGRPMVDWSIVGPAVMDMICLEVANQQTGEDHANPEEPLDT